MAREKANSEQFRARRELREEEYLSSSVGAANHLAQMLAQRKPSKSRRRAENRLSKVVVQGGALAATKSSWVRRLWRRLSSRMRRVILPAMLEKIKESVLLQGKLPRVRSLKFEETRAIGFHCTSLSTCMLFHMERMQRVH